MKSTIYTLLDNLKIAYEATEHEAVFTIAEMEALELHKMGDICKNLFVRDAKGKRHFLIVAHEDTKVNLGELGEKLNAGKLSFGSAQRLEKYLGVEAGAVSPFGIVNDTNQAVTIILDSSLKGKSRLGVHPNDNTATVWISFDGLVKFIDAQGNDLQIISL